MELMQLEMLVALVQEGSIRGAAKRVFRTEPAVSIAIRKLEDEIGMPLFNRPDRYTHRLTEVGETLYSYAVRILSLRTEVMGALDDLCKLRMGLLRIGATESLCLHVLPKLTQAFLERHPGVRMEFLCDQPDNSLRALKDRKLDVALVPFRPKDLELESEFVVRDELVLIAGPEHPLTAKGRVEIKNLTEERLLILGDPQQSRWHQKVVDTFVNFNTPFKLTIGNAPIETIKKMVAIGIGLGVVPLMSVREERMRGELAVIDVDGLCEERWVWLVRRKDSEIPAVKAFFQIALTFAKELRAGHLAKMERTTGEVQRIARRGKRVMAKGSA